MGGLKTLSILVMNNMDTLTSVRGALLQQVSDAMQGVRADLIVHIQSRLGVARKTFELLLCVIRDIPNEVVALFRSNLASLIQAIMAEVQAVSDDMHADKARAVASSSIEAFPKAIRSRLDSCLVAAHVAMSAHVQLVTIGLRSLDISFASFADVSMEVSNDVQYILSAKVVLAMQECFEDAHPRTKGTSRLSENEQTGPRTEIVPGVPHELIGTSEDVLEEAVQAERGSEETAENALMSTKFVSAPDDRALHSLSSTVSTTIELHEDSSISSSGKITNHTWVHPSHPTRTLTWMTKYGFLAVSGTQSYVLALVSSPRPGNVNLVPLATFAILLTRRLCISTKKAVKQ
eukprot:TRINITY_DN11214_c0_g2_i1.p1 TRINITY_DN11214_c0_g2~~TRINITY_DN11214_c0_g2_i1.p1  ORF type:complete len:348 (-),score=43.20 TRINITY_DN11214_c0_g2_i1:536-1579(-)